MKKSLSGIWTTLAMFGTLIAPASAFASSADDWTLSNSYTTSSTDAKTKLSMNISRCRGMFDINTGEINFIFTLAQDAYISEDAKYTVKYALGNETCSKTLEDVTSEPCITIIENQALTTTTSPIEIKRDVDTLSSAKDADSCENLNETAYIHLIVSDPQNGFENTYTVSYVLDFRTTRPDAPSGITAAAGGESIKLNWTSTSNASSYKIYYAKEGAVMEPGDNPESLKNVHSATSSSNSITIKDNIDANETYLISVTSVDSNGNESLLGEIVTADTVPSNSFWDTYREENRDVDGGFCFIATAAYGSTQEPHVVILRQFRDQILKKSAPGRAFIDTYYRVSPPAAYYIKQHPTLRAATRFALWPLYGFAYLLLNLPIVLWSLLGLLGSGVAFLAYRKCRRKKEIMKAAAPILAAAIAGSACFFAPDNAYADSPVNMMAEFKAGPYTPENLGDAYNTHFGEKSGFIVEGEYDWQFWRGVGSLGLGFHLAYGKVSGKSLDEDGNESVDATQLHWLPLRLSLIYRFDYLWTRFNFPFTLYVKAGFDYAAWWIKDGADNIARDKEGKKGYGGTFGFHAVAGIAFVLDWLAPDMEKAIDVEWGINNSYIFAEYMYSQLDNFGSQSAFNLTDKATFQIGIGLEF